MQVLETERLILRQQTVDDAEFIFRLVNDPAWLKHIGDRGVKSVDDARAYIMNGAVKSYAQNGFGLYLVETKQNRAPIGICGLVKRDGLDDVDLGFAWMPEYRAMGYGFEAAAATMIHARRDIGLKRVVAITSPENIASIALLRKLGFQLEKMVRMSPTAPETALFAAMSAVVRPARIDEAGALAVLAERTFRHTYAEENTEADMEAHVTRSFGPALQAAELRDANMTTIVAELGVALAGFAQIRTAPAPACVKQNDALEIWRFYVDREHHGRGVAQELMSGVFDAAKQRGASSVWLGVWERNWRARAFYAKCGFKDVGTQTFVLGDDQQTDRVFFASLA